MTPVVAAVLKELELAGVPSHRRHAHVDSFINAVIDNLDREAMEMAWSSADPSVARNINRMLAAARPSGMEDDNG